MLFREFQCHRQNARIQRRADVPAHALRQALGNRQAKAGGRLPALHSKIAVEQPLHLHLRKLRRVVPELERAVRRQANA